MGITKLTHINSGAHTKHQHLQKAIEYIMDPSKTEGGIFIGSNCGAYGATPQGVLHTMLDTKEAFSKLDGRQAYHFIISLKPGEGTPPDLYDICQEFCDEYLQDNYDYVFAVHTDQEHLHGHLIFNSVSRTTGFKYHYSDGDWEKYIQPITDEACTKRGFEKLVWDKEKTVGVSYAEWASKTEQKFTTKDIIRADIDKAIDMATTYDEFKNILYKMGYKITREGTHKQTGKEYLSVLSPISKKAQRTFTLGDEYTVEAIKERIAKPNNIKAYESLSETAVSLFNDRIKKPKGFLVKTQTWFLIKNCTDYYRLPNPFLVDQAQVRKDLRQLNKHLAEGEYIQKNNVSGIDWLINRQGKLKEREKQLRKEQRAVNMILGSLDSASYEAALEYDRTQQALETCPADDYDTIEFLEDSIDRLEAEYPQQVLEAISNKRELKKELKALRSEKGIVRGIIQTEQSLHVVDPAQVQKPSPPLSGPSPAKPDAEVIPL